MSQIISYCLRFKTNCLRPKQRKNGFFLPCEINHAKIVMIKIVQYPYFSREIQQLRADNSSSIKKKVCFKD